MPSTIDRLSNFFLQEFENQRAAHFFCKALVGFVLVKTILLWTLSTEMAGLGHITEPLNFSIRLIFQLAIWAGVNHTLAHLFIVIALLVILWLPWNYVGAALFFWINMNLAKIQSPFLNGSDLVTTTLSFWMIGLGTFPVFRAARVNLVQRSVYALSYLFCQLQLIAIYGVSGWDKVMSETWRSGKAFQYISYYDLLNPVFSGIQQSTTLQFILSWMTILFELSFLILVWFRATRIPILLVGVVFHLVIIVMLTLPDFGIVMILSYLVFLKDSDYDRIRIFFKRLRP